MDIDFTAKELWDIQYAFAKAFRDLQITDEAKANYEQIVNELRVFGENNGYL